MCLFLLSGCPTWILLRSKDGGTVQIYSWIQCWYLATQLDLARYWSVVDVRYCLVDIIFLAWTCLVTIFKLTNTSRIWCHISKLFFDGNNAGSHQIISWLDGIRYSESPTSNVWSGWMCLDICTNFGNLWFVCCMVAGMPHVIMTFHITWIVFRPRLVDGVKSGVEEITMFQRTNKSYQNSTICFERGIDPSTKHRLNAIDTKSPY
jgi:hypothetical protein